MDRKHLLSGLWRALSKCFLEGRGKTNLCFPVGGRVSH